MKFEIDGKEFTETDLTNWKMKRIPKVARNLRKSIRFNKDAKTLNEELAKIKADMTYEEIVSSIKYKLKIGEVGMKLAVLFSFGERRTSETTIYADGIHVDKLGKSLIR